MTAVMPTSFIVDPSTFGIEGAAVTVQVTASDDAEATLVACDQTLSLHMQASGRVISEYVEDLGGWLGDLIASKACVRDEADVLLLRRSASGRRWLTLVTRERDIWRGEAIELADISGVNVSYTVSEGEEQTADLAANHRHFMALAGNTLFPLVEKPKSVLLRVKVTRDELWFLRFPFGAYAKLKLQGFESYKACQTIVTTRSISEVASRQATAEREWTETRNFFDSTIFILNTYQAHEKAEGAAETDNAFRLLVELLESLQDLPLPDGIAGLQWTMNPSSDQLQSILLSETTRFVVADFEAAGGVWSLGDREHRCAGECEHKPNGATFDLTSLRGKLRHVRLMRVFHCNSLFDAYRASSQPADDSTIAAALLATDAGFVEGSLTAEPVIDFVCEALTLLLSRADVRAMLTALTAIGICDFLSLKTRANALLQQRGFTAV
jgi:hypothetical protein